MKSYIMQLFGIGFTHSHSFLVIHSGCCAYPYFIFIAE